MRQIHNQLNRIHIMRNHHQLSLLVLNQSHTVIQSLLDKHGLVPDFAVLLASVLGDNLCFLDKTSFLFLRGLRTVFVEKFEQSGGGVFIEDMGELSESGRDLESFLQDLFLTLK